MAVTIQTCNDTKSKSHIHNSSMNKQTHMNESDQAKKRGNKIIQINFIPKMHRFMCVPVQSNGHILRLT